MLFLILMLFSIKDVYAQDQYKLTLIKQDNIYIYREGENFGNDSQNYYLYKFNDMYAYCIEPGKHIKTTDYYGIDDFIELNISDEIKEELELIGYFGRDYPGHDNIRYSMATQALIWELTGVDKVTFWTKLNANGEEIDVTKERNEIMDLVNKQKLLPSISNSIEANLNEEIILSDENKVLNNYEITSDDGNEVSIVDNSLHINPKVVGKTTISLKYRKYDDEKTIIFVGKDNVSQVMGRLRLSREKSIDIKLNTKGIKLVVQKVDEEGNKVGKEGIKFKIKDSSNNSYICENNICEYKTNSEGVFITKELNNGEYEIEEILDQEIPGFIINHKSVQISINEETKYQKENNTNYINTNFTNDRIKGKLEFKKEDLTTGEGIPNTIIEIYDEKDNLLFTKTTDEFGQVIIDDLLYGKYYIQEKEANSMYQITNEKVYFEIKENGEIVKAKMTNEKKVVKVPKTDTLEETIVHTLCAISLLIGIWRFFYERQKTS